MNLVQKIKEFRIQELDSSHVEKQYILSYNDRNFVINHNTKHLIDIVQGSDGKDEMVENFREILHCDLSFDELELKLSKKFETILSDILGVPNLRKKGFEYLLYCIKRLFGKCGGEKPAFMYYSKATRYVSIVYSIVSILFIGFVLLYWMPMFTWHFGQNIPHWYQQLLFNISSGEVNWEFISYLIPQLLFMTCIVITYFSIFKMFTMQLMANIRYINFKKSMAVAAMLLAVVSNAGA